MNKFIQTESKKDKEKNEKLKTKWAKFTYIDTKAKFFTKLLKKFHLKIPFKTDKTKGKYLTRNKNNLNKFDKCGIHQLKCLDCNKKYIGQTEKPIHIKFQEHFRDYKYGNNN